MAGDGDFSSEKHDEGPRDLRSIREKHWEIEREMANSSVVSVEAAEEAEEEREKAGHRGASLPRYKGRGAA